MKELFPLRGIITVLNTPFTEDDQIDLPALKRHVSIALEAGVAGFLVPAMAAEVQKLEVAERISMVAAVIEVVQGKVPVFAGIGDTDLGRSKSLLQNYLGLGCKHVLFQIPFENPDQFKTHFYALAELDPEVIMLQDWDATGYGLPDDMVLELFQEVDAFRCLKIETQLSGIKYTRMLALTEGRLHVSGGWAVGQMMEGLRRGIHAFMPTGMHYIYTKIFNDYDLGYHQSARDLFEEVLPVLSFSNQHLDFSIQFFKRLLYRQGVYANAKVRHPTMEFDFIQNEIASELIERLLVLEQKIKNNNYKGKTDSQNP